MRCLLPLVAACSSSTLPRSASPELVVPFGTAPVIDGAIDAREWAGAAVVALDHDVTLRFMHDRERVYIAVDRPKPTGFVCVLVADGSDVDVLHASAKLGTATYVARPNGTYDPRSKDYVWRDRDAMLREQGWFGTTMHTDAPPAQELAITLARLRGPIAISFFHAEPGADLSAAGTVVWPAGLDDGVANVQLVAGFNPDGLRFDTTRWVVLKPR